ncbi:MAG TPA: hypothetical protein VFG97_04645, partial [Pedococcus sp.]|nr:hypothetical protein [Pedococcus sp.]
MASAGQGMPRDRRPDPGTAAGPGRVTIVAEDKDWEAVISIEDDGVGEDPERVRQALAGDTSLDSIG